LQPPDFIGAASAGSRAGLSMLQMIQDAKDKAAALALQRSEIASRAESEGANRAQRGSEDAAANALNYAQLKQQGILGTQKLQNQATALDQREGNLTAREALDNAKAESLQRQKPIFSNTGGGLMQFDENSGKWGLVPGSSKAAPRQSEGTVKVPMNPAHPEQGSIDVPINSPAYQKWNALKSTVTPTAAVPAVPDSRFLGIPIPFTGTAAKPAGSVTNNPPSLSQFMQSSQNNSAAAALKQPEDPVNQLPLAPGASKIPQSHIDYLNAHPETANDFQSKYGVDPLNYITNSAPAAPSQSETDSE
jgi:hypothetical protein